MLADNQQPERYLERVDRALPEFRISADKFILWTLTLYFGAVPVLSLLIEAVPIQVPHHILLLFGLSSLILAVTIVLSRLIVEGSLTLVIVLSTFNANLPVGSSAPWPGGMVNSIQAFLVPLLFIVIVLIFYYQRTHWKPTAVIGGIAFLFTIAVPVIVGTADYPEPVLWFGLYFTAALLAFIISQWSTSMRKLSFERITATFIGAVAGHSLWAIFQFYTQGVVGLGPIGEGVANTITEIQVPLIGVMGLNTNMGGFTGFSFTLAGLAVLAIPLTVYKAVFARQQSHRYLYGLLSVLFPAVIFLSTSDAARGAAIIGAVFFVIALFVGHFFKRESNVTAPQLIQVAAVTGVVLLLLSVSVASLAPVATTPSDSSQSSNPTGDSNPVSGIASSDPADRPLFDTSNLGIRLSLISVGLTIWLDHPIVGIGMFNFVKAGAGYGLPMLSDGVTYPIHNVPILILVGTGLIGLLSSIFWVAEVCNEFYRGIKSSLDGKWILSSATVSGITGLAALGMFDHLLVSNPEVLVPSFVVLGAAVGYTNR